MSARTFFALIFVAACFEACGGPESFHNKLVPGQGGVSGGAAGTGAAGTIPDPSGTAGTVPDPMGVAGTTASAGVNGAAGTQAAAGVNGAAGTQAAAGTNGTAGTKGTAGTAAAGVNGAAGTAAAGVNGAAGTAAAGVNGAAGTVAPTGPVTRIDANGTAAGGWVADVDFVGGNPGQGVSAAIDTAGVAMPAPQTVYQSTRIGAFTYTVAGYTGMHTVRLHMAETYFPPAGDTIGGAGRRLCNIMINGTMVETNYDIFVKAGNAKLKAVVPEYKLAPNAQGQYVIAFTPTKDNCALGGLEIL